MRIFYILGFLLAFSGLGPVNATIPHHWKRILRTFRTADSSRLAGELNINKQLLKISLQGIPNTYQQEIVARPAYQIISCSNNYLPSDEDQRKVYEAIGCGVLPPLDKDN